MRLPEFITGNLDAILVEWVSFARQQLPAAEQMDDEALLDHGRQILQAIAKDMAKPQGEAEQQAKSEGNSSTASKSSSVPSRSHGRDRERSGFHIEQMVGEYRALRATVFRLWTAASKITQVEDVEDITRFNEAVDQAIAESLQVFVAAVDKSRDIFLAVLGHDMRGPLGVIANSTALALRTHPNDSRHALVVLRSVAQIKSMLDDLVEYTRNQIGSGVVIKPKNFRLDEFARNTLEEISALGSSHALELETSGDLEVEWDARRLHQALSNLVFNALKYGNPGSAIQIILDGTSKDEVVLAVQNTGKAIPQNSLASVFEPLFRVGGVETGADSQIAGANLGLGLYVVREIATAHGGTVEVTSDDSATRFELRLPRFCNRQGP